MKKQLPEAIISIKEYGNVNVGKPGEVYIRGLHGVPDVYLGTKHDDPAFFYWEKGTPKEANHWLFHLWLPELFKLKQFKTFKI